MPPSTRGQYFRANGNVKAKLRQNLTARSQLQPLDAAHFCVFLTIFVALGTKITRPAKHSLVKLYTYNALRSGILIAAYPGAIPMSKVKTSLGKSRTLASRPSTLWRAKSGIVMLALTLLLGGCDVNKETAPPQEMIGTYTTNDPRYKGLYFRIAKDSFDFSTVEGTVENYPILAYEKLEKTERRRTIIYHRLHGKRDGQEFRVSFNFEPAGGGSIWFLNRPSTIWVREGNTAQ